MSKTRKFSLIYLVHALANTLFGSLTGLDMSSSAGSTVPDEASVSDAEVQPVSDEEDSDWVAVYHYFNRKLIYIYIPCVPLLKLLMQRNS